MDLQPPGTRVALFRGGRPERAGIPMVRFPLVEPPAESSGAEYDWRKRVVGEEAGQSDRQFRGVAHLPPPRPGPWLAASGLLHLVAVAALVFVPLLWLEPLPLLESQLDPVRILIYDPPPPPPPPLPKGSPEGGRPSARTAPVEPRPMATPLPSVAREEKLLAPVEKASFDEAVGLSVEAPGSPQGSESGIPEGMAEGVEGGVAGAAYREASWGV